MLRFCPKCGSILIPEEGGKKGRLRCSCGYRTREKKNVVIKEKMDVKDKVEVMKENIETLPKVSADCKKCGHKKAYYWMVQTRAADEAETKFYECVKCGHRWREYS